MSGLLERIGRGSVRRPWLTIVFWVLLVVAALGVASAAGGTTADDYDVPGTSSQAGTDLLRERFPQLAGTEARVVLHNTGGALDAGVVQQVTQRLGEVPDVGFVGEPRVSDDGDTALIDLRYRVPVTDLGAGAVDELREAAAPATGAGLTVEYAGQVPEGERAGGSSGEVAGLLAALVVLVLAFGSVLAAGLPILVALFGLGFGMAIILLLAAVTEVGTSAPTSAAMIGLGVGIDYALLIITRHVEGLRGGLSPAEAAVRAITTAGRSVLVAGATVLISLAGLFFSGLAAFRSFGYATMLMVVAMLLASITLVPALSVLAGRRLLSRRARKAADAGHGLAAAVTAPTLTGRWAAAVARRPLAGALGALTVLLLLAAPALSMRTWPQDAGTQSSDQTVRRAYDLIAAEYGPGAYAPLAVVVDLDRTPAAELEPTVARLAAVPGVAEVGAPLISADGRAAVISVQAAYAPKDERTPELVETLRSGVLPPGAEVTGVTAVFVDIAGLLAERLWLVVALVVGVSILFQIIVFRSLLVPLKAAVVNLLGVSAAYGVLTAVFQFGWGHQLVGIDHAVPVSTWVPLLLFAALFGLSMDYEVFLLSRIREEWLRTGDPRASVIRGLAATGRVITCAALIMVVVFAGFISSGDIILKMIGLGLAAAVALDATVIRMVLVPATMTLFGKANWWLPSWLDRILPAVRVEAPETPAASEEAEPVAATR
ncbi:MMPL family transporter [Actinoplanes sp. NPDC023714]|uniref:MMPL family transporter n=1 Tax=Actinoplanes sp. NPDC023714 TaxID=3154322 RepID=UPI0033F1CDDC